MRTKSNPVDLPIIRADNDRRLTYLGVLKDTPAQAIEAAKAAAVVANPGPVFQDTTGFTSFADSEIKSDIMKHPGPWRPPTSYTFSKVKDGRAVVYTGYRSIDYGYTIRHTSEGVKYEPWYATEGEYRASRIKLYPGSTHVDSSRYELEMACMQKVKSDGFNAAMALLESQKSAALLAEYIRRIAGIVKAVRKKDPQVLLNSFRVIKRDKRKYQRKSADLWLETIYGLRPLVYDASGVVKLMQDNLKEQEQLIVARASTSTKVNGSPVWTALQPDLKANDRSPRSCYANVTTDSRLDEAVNFWFKVDDPRLVMARELGFTNPASLAWDAIPLVSLLVDWVYPIGQYLDLLDWNLGLAFKGGAYTSFRESETRAEGFKSGGVPCTTMGVTPARSIQFDRSRYIVPPQPQLPKLRNPFGVERAISAVSLLRQRLK